MSRGADVQRFYTSKELRILNVIWGPHTTVMSHNHLVWAMIGIYTGREDNIFFWCCIADSDGRRIEAARAKSLGKGDAEPLGCDVSHTLANPLRRLTGAIYLYGGDFFGIARSQWDRETLLECPCDSDEGARPFEGAANAMPQT